MKEKKDSIRDAYIKFKKDPENNKDTLLKVLNDYKSAWLRERKNHYDRIWKNNLAFYSGNHYVRLNRTTNTYRVLLRENHTNPTLNRVLSIIVQNIPIVRLFANSQTSEDIANAETTEQYGKYYHRVNKIEQKLRKHVKHSLIFGSSFVHTYWDEQFNGKIVLNPDDQEQLNPEELTSNEDKIADYKGDVKTSVDDPFKWLFRPGIEEMDDMYDCIRSVAANRHELEKAYGNIESEPINAFNVITKESRSDDDLVLQHHYWHKPTPWFPEGLYISWVGTKLLKVRESLKCEEKLPVDHLPFDQLPMHFYGMSGIELVMDLQEQLNRASSMIVEARNLVSRPRWWVTRQAKVAAQQFTDRPGTIMEYDMAGGAPQIVVPPFNFNELGAHKADLKNNLTSILGMSAASRGELPQATRTALALQLVLEQDRSQFAPFIGQFFQNIIDIYYKIFANCAEFIDESDPRKVKIEGSGYSTKVFHGGLVPTPADVYLEDSNKLGWTVTGRIEEVGHLIDRGLITDKNQALEMLDIKSPDPAYKWININRLCQQREIEDLKKGKRVIIGPEDDDNIHLEILTEAMASYEFKNKPQVVREAFIDHAAQHKQRLAQGQAPQPQGNVKPKQAPEGGLQAGLNPIEPGQNMNRLLGK